MTIIQACNVLRYVLKIKSSTKIPDFLQIRDEQFVLLGYIRLDKELDDLKKYGLERHIDAFNAFIATLAFGKLAKFEIGV